MHTYVIGLGMPKAFRKLQKYFEAWELMVK